MELNTAVDLAVANILANSCSDITKETVEQLFITEFRNEFTDEIKQKARRSSFHEMEFKPIQYLLTPKNRFVFDYRKAAIIDPHCLAKYLSLVLRYADTIELHRIPTADQIVFSSRFSPNGTDLFDQNINYSAWHARTKELAATGDCNYIVRCDIAAFYDRINIHRIESTLASIGVPTDLVKKTNDLLLFWSKKDSYGIPVGNNASRILAEASLIAIDQFLISEGIKFTRYVDDYRLFAPDLIEAQRWMNKLTTRLFRDGLMLNTGKTSLHMTRKDPIPEVLEPADEAEEVLRVITTLAGGYNRIVRKFIMPASDTHEIFKRINISQELSLIAPPNILEFKGIQKIVIACLVQQQFDHLVYVAEACTRFMYALDYFVDMLIKNAAYIPSQKRNEIATFYATMVMKSGFYSFDWYEAVIARLLSQGAYFQKEALLFIIKNRGKESSTYPSMIALEGLRGKLTRSEFLTVRDWFERCDDWEKRRILWLSNVLPDEERKAWARAVKPMFGSDLVGKLYVDSIIHGNAI